MAYDVDIPTTSMIDDLDWPSTTKAIRIRLVMNGDVILKNRVIF